MRITMGVRLATEFCYDCMQRYYCTATKRYYCKEHGSMLDDLEGDDMVGDRRLQRNSIKLDECKLRNFGVLVEGVRELKDASLFVGNVCRVLLLMLVCETVYTVCGTFGATATLLGAFLVMFALSLYTAWEEGL